MFDRKCIPGDGCWYCCHKSDNLQTSSLKEPLEEVVFLLFTDGGETPSGEITAMHLLSVTLSYCGDKRNLCPTRAVVDIHRVEKGGNHLPPGRYIALFEVRTDNKQMFGEFFLTDELQLGKPLPHVKWENIDKEQVELLSDTLQKAIQESGHDVGYIRSLGLQTKSPAQQTPEEESLV